MQRTFLMNNGHFHELGTFNPDATHPTLRWEGVFAGPLALYSLVMSRYDAVNNLSLQAVRI